MSQHARPFQFSFTVLSSFPEAVPGILRLSLLVSGESIHAFR